MSFAVFRKYQKPLLWVTVVFCILIFATFSGFDDLQRLVSGTDPDLIGRFTVLSTGEQAEVSATEFFQIRSNMSKLYWPNRIEEDDMWVFLMNKADADAAGIRISDRQLTQALSGGNEDFAAAYHGQQGGEPLWRLRGFPSPRDFEETVRDQLAAQAWVDHAASTAGIVSLDEVYLRWRVDNERFDLDAIVFDDLDPEDVADPGDEVLKAYYDEMQEAVRERRFRNPATFDIAYAWLALDTPLETLPPDKVAALNEPSASEINYRFQRVRYTRAPDASVPDEALTAELTREVKLLALARNARAAFDSLEEKTKETLKQTTEAHGLTFVDPEGLLGPDELKELEPMQDASLSAYLGGRQVDDVVVIEPFLDQTHVSLAMIEARTEDIPLQWEDEGCRDQVLDAWRGEQVDQAAQEFREELRRRTRSLPEVAELIEPLESQARDNADARIGVLAGESDDPPDEAEQQAIRDEEDAKIEPAILGRLAEHEHKVWADLVAETVVGDGVVRMSVEGVPRSYARKPDPEIATDTIDHLLRTHTQIFSQAVDGITPALRHGPSKRTAIVRVSARSFPEQQVMLADEDGMTSARQQLSAQREQQSRTQYSDPDWCKLQHQLQVVQQEVPAQP